MTPQEFFALGLRPGDKVKVTLGKSKPVDAFFDGFKTFGERILRDPDYDLFPVFRAVSKNGRMLNNAPWPGHSTGEGFSSITACKKIKCDDPVASITSLSETFKAVSMRLEEEIEQDFKAVFEKWGINTIDFMDIDQNDAPCIRYNNYDGAAGVVGFKHKAGGGILVLLDDDTDGSTGLRSLETAEMIDVWRTLREDIVPCLENKEYIVNAEGELEPNPQEKPF